MAKNFILIILGNIFNGIGSGLTALAIPWLMIHKVENGEATLGYVTILASLLTVIILPYAGITIDRFSRKKVLLFALATGSLVTTALALQITSYLATLISAFFLATVLHSFYSPALVAFIQEIFSPEEYQRVNGWMEVQGQVAMMSAGALGTILLQKVSLSTILYLDAATYMIAALIFSQISQQRSISTKEEKIIRGSGLEYIRENFALSLFLLFSLFPFLMVIVVNYLAPIHIGKTLGKEAWYFGMMEVLWAIGAIVAGLTAPVFMKRFGPYRTILVAFSVFVSGVLICTQPHQVWIFIAVCFAIGWSNACIRVARVTTMMRLIPHDRIGRVNTTIVSVGTVLRIGFMSAAIYLVTHHNTYACFAFMLCLLVLALILTFLCLRRLPNSTQ